VTVPELAGRSRSAILAVPSVVVQFRVAEPLVEPVRTTVMFA